jgi:RES domain-containing protein
MSEPLVTHHIHVPVYRVVPREFKEPLDASYSQQTTDRRWNTPEFPALYCCCCELVAQSIVLDIYRVYAFRATDLQPSSVPQLLEIRWSGHVVDVATSVGVAALGLDPAYPDRTPKDETRRLAIEWHAQGREGVVCRSASMARSGHRNWNAPHERWGELAVFVRNCSQPPILSGIREDSRWFLSE